MWLALALAWGSVHLFRTRMYMAANQVAHLHSGGDIMSEERDWRFGQFLPVILLALPLLSIWESYAGK